MKTARDFRQSGRKKRNFIQLLAHDILAKEEALCAF
jgi:hypothetical protein